MNKLTIIIPTRHRINKLEKTLGTIPNLPYISIHIVCDGDVETYNYLKEKYENKIRISLVESQKGSLWCRNYIIQDENDGVLCGTDDIEFEEMSIQNAYETFNKHFLDDDGVVGFVQKPGQFDFAGVALVGKRFIERYPQKQLFCPVYFHFGSQEIYRLCEKIKQETKKTTFVQDENAVIYHYHPSFFPEMMDKTHEEARLHRSRDLLLSKTRKNKGLVWGRVV